MINTKQNKKTAGIQNKLGKPQRRASEWKQTMADCRVKADCLHEQGR